VRYQDAPRLCGRSSRRRAAIQRSRVGRQQKIEGDRVWALESARAQTPPGGRVTDETDYFRLEDQSSYSWSTLPLLHASIPGSLRRVAISCNDTHCRAICSQVSFRELPSALVLPNQNSLAPSLAGKGLQLASCRSPRTIIRRERQRQRQRCAPP